MIKVLVVDDEPPILKGIIKLIEAANSNFHVVAQAYDGREAAAILDRNEIDVVFTDITMPLMGGIALLKYIAANHKHIITVLLTGYAEFEYAKSAVTYNAYEYLLKPLDENLLIPLLGKLERHIARNFYDEQYTYLMNAVHETCAPQLSRRLSGERRLQTAVFCAGPLSTHTASVPLPGSDFWQTADFEKVVKNLLPAGSFVWFIPGNHANERILFMSLLPAFDTEVIVHELYIELNTSAVPVTVCFAGSAVDMADAGNTYRHIHALLGKNIRFGRASFLPADFVPAQKEYQTSLDQLENLIAINIELKNFSDLHKDITSLFSEMDARQFPQVELESVLTRLNTVIRKHTYISATLSDMNAAIYDLVTANYRYDTLLASYLETLDGFLSETLRKSETDIEAVVQKAARYIDDHLNSPLNNQILSRMLRMPPAFIGKIFKNHLGVTPGEYIIKRRMEKAMNLLQESNGLMIKEITQIIGFEDPLYFSRAFKKYTGYNPAQFRRNTVPKRD